LRLGGIIPNILIADEKHIFITSNEDNVIGIHILDVDTFNRMASLEVGKNAYTHSISIKKLDMNEYYLVALIEIYRNDDIYDGHMTAMVWKRDPIDTFKFSKHAVEIHKVKFPRRLPFIVETRFYGNVLIHASKVSMS
jgi:hypothetical protein